MRPWQLGHGLLDQHVESVRALQCADAPAARCAKPDELLVQAPTLEARN